MKKSALLILLIILLPFASALNVNLNENYQPGQTLIGSLEGNFLSPLITENFYFYSDRVQVPLVSDISKIQDKYYFYALLPVSEGNYTLLIKNLHYVENGVEQTRDIEKNFTVSGNITDFSVSPGVLILRNESIITIESKNEPLVVLYKFTNQTGNILIPAGQKKKLTFSSAGYSEFKFTEIEISALNTKYLIPTAVIPASQSTRYQENVTETSSKLRFLLQEYNFSVYANEISKFNIDLINSGTNPASNIQLTSNLGDIISINPLEISLLEDSDLQQIEITINAKETKTFKGLITASMGDFSVQTLVTINSQLKGSPQPPTTVKSCVGMNGVRCADGEECTGVIQIASDGDCCISGLCTEKSSSSGWIIGIILLLVVAAVIYYFYKKSKKNQITPEGILKQKQEKFESKMSGEVKGGLTRS